MPCSSHNLIFIGIMKGNRMIEKYIALLDQEVIITYTDGARVRGIWIDCLEAEDVGDDERAEDAVLIQAGEELIEIFISEIKKIEKLIY